MREGSAWKRVARNAIDAAAGSRDRIDLLSHATATENFAPFEHHGLEPGARQIEGGRQTVVPTANDDDIVWSHLDILRRE